MTGRYVCFGEMLWDVLPSARHAGGAPFNVAVHLARLGQSVELISAVGTDAAGDELVGVAGGKGVGTRFVSRSPLPTGAVTVALDAAGNASYDIARPVAWDDIAVTADAAAAAGNAAAVVFGSLALRGEANRAALDRLLERIARDRDTDEAAGLGRRGAAVDSPAKAGGFTAERRAAGVAGVAAPRVVFDANLRPPFDDLSLVLDLARRADVLKLNHDEAARLAEHAGGRAAAGPSLAAVADACAAIGDATGVRRVCVTMAAAGAAFWHDGVLLHAAASPVEVRDTVGAGDAFTAALVVGLTHAAPPRAVLDAAVRLGGFVAGQNGATPDLPPALAAELVARLKTGGDAVGSSA